MMMAAKTLASSVLDVYSNPSIIEEAWKELKSKTGADFLYEPLIGDRKPALNYRK